jgi:hypothetical protein
VAPAIAHARPEGITGYSGKQGESCNDRCHFGGVPPVVRLEGPSAVTAGALATFRFVVESQSTRQMLAGFNVAASDGELGEEPDQSVRLEFGELTHAFPKGGEQGAVVWDFTWRAPDEPGQQVLYAAGLSANGNGNTNGDESAATTLPVTVTVAPQAGDANCDGQLSAADVPQLVRLVVDGEADACGRADANCDNAVNADDLPTLVASLFADGAGAACN